MYMNNSNQWLIDYYFLKILFLLILTFIWIEIKEELKQRKYSDGW